MNCCKLYLVPEDVIQTWRAEQREKAVDRPAETVTNTIDSTMGHLLEAPDLNDYDKEKLFSQELAKFLNMRKQMQQQQQAFQVPIQQPASMPSSTSSRDSVEESILASIPKTYRAKAAGLMHYLKSDPNVTWDDNGQLVIGGTTYTGSHMVDLINDALRSRKRMKRPRGWRELSSHLAQRNVPRELVGNQAWFKTSPPTPPSPSPQPDLTTPKTKRFPTTAAFIQSTIKKPRPTSSPRTPTFHTPGIDKWEDVSD